MNYENSVLESDGLSEKMVYEKPILEKQESMVFPEEIWQQFNEEHWCFGCTNCNCN